MKINVMYVIEELELGGAERVVIDQATMLDRERYNAIVCCLRAKGAFAADLEKGHVPVVELCKKPGFDPSVLAKLRKVIKDHRIDVVHTHLWVANLWGRMAGILSGVKVVVTEHNVDVWKGGVHKAADRLLAPFTARICAVSWQVRHFYVDDVGIHPKKVEVVYNGTRTAVKSRDEDRNRALKRELGIRDDRPVIVNIGRLVEAKAHPVFFEALRLLDRQGMEFNALTVGDGPLKGKLLAEGQDLIESGRLLLTGLRKDVDRILDIADISVLASTREGFSMVVLESMAKGVPVVATRVGGNPEQIIDGKTGLLVDTGDSEALAEAMKRILSDSELARRMSLASRRRVEEEFSLSKMMKRTESIYEDILPRRAVRR